MQVRWGSGGELLSPLPRPQPAGVQASGHVQGLQHSGSRADKGCLSVSWPRPEAASKRAHSAAEGAAQSGFSFPWAPSPFPFGSRATGQRRRRDPTSFRDKAPQPELHSGNSLQARKTQAWAGTSESPQFVSSARLIPKLATLIATDADLAYFAPRHVASLSLTGLLHFPANQLPCGTS